MATEDERQDTDLKESILKKGGLDTRPIVPRPAKPPQGQNPEPAQSSNNETDSD
ncbi:MAG: hypothetical protein IIB94_09815 [Candidatus Marinimicrobia bacterium]|nr:hypothetical protein [Candidatus Neomarinimicrobiota bacterium]